MIKRSEIKKFQERYTKMLDDVGIAYTPAEREALEVAEFGLGEFERTGLGLIVYENNDRYCAKELVLFPRQTCPEHVHPPIKDDAGNVIDPGKRETFRCRDGEVFLYVTGDATPNPSAKVPHGSEAHYTVWNEVVLKPGEQYTIEPGVWHWFQAGDQGAVVSEFSTTSRDEADLFTDPRIERLPQVEEDC